MSLSPLPTVTSGVIVQLLAAEKLNDAFGKNEWKVESKDKYLISFLPPGVLTFIRGGSALLGPPLAGFLADTFSDFSLPFSLATGMEIYWSTVIGRGMLVLYGIRELAPAIPRI